MLQTQHIPSSVNPASFHLINSFSAHSKCTLFQEQITRTFPGWYFQDSKNHINPFTPTQDLNANSLYCLPYISYFLLEFKRFPELSRTSGLFPGHSSPEKIATIKFQDPYSLRVYIKRYHLWKLFNSLLNCTFSLMRVEGSLDLPCQMYLFFAYLLITSTLSKTLTMSYIRLLSTPAR